MIIQIFRQTLSSLATNKAHLSNYRNYFFLLLKMTEKLRYDGTYDDLVDKYSYLRTNKFILRGYRLGMTLFNAPKTYFILYIVDYFIYIMKV